MKPIHCPRCGAAANYGAPGCAQCGAAFVAPPRSASSFTAPTGKAGIGKKVLGIGTALTALAAIGLAGGFFVPKLATAGKQSSPQLKSSDSSRVDVRAGASSDAPNLADLGGGNAPDLSAIASAEAPVLKSEAAPASAPTLAVQTSSAPTLASNSGMPQDVHDWLEHLRQTEAARNTLAQQQITQAMQALTQIQAQKMTSAMDEDPNDDPSAELRQKASGLTSGLQASWTSLRSQFDSKPAPADCATAKSEYDATLMATGQMLIELIAAINSASQDPQAAINALRSMQGTSGSRIDVHASATDSEVGSICARYQTSKWFSISKDIGDSGLLSKIGID